MDYAVLATDTVRRVLVKAAVLAAAFAAPLVLSAVAHAEPDPNVPPDPNAPVVVDPAAICASPEVGGVLTTAPPAPDGITRMQCQYIVSGRFYYDNYENGVYTGTLVYWDGATVPTERPQMPEILNIPGNIPAPVIPFPGQF